MDNGGAAFWAGFIMATILWVVMFFGILTSIGCDPDDWECRLSKCRKTINGYREYRNRVDSLSAEYDSVLIYQKNR